MLSYCSVFCLQSKTLGHTLGFLNHGLGHSCICIYCIWSGLGGPVPTPTELYMLLLYTASPSLYGCTVRWHVRNPEAFFFLHHIHSTHFCLCYLMFIPGFTLIFHVPGLTRSTEALCFLSYFVFDERKGSLPPYVCSSAYHCWCFLIYVILVVCIIILNKELLFILWFYFFDIFEMVVDVFN